MMKMETAYFTPIEGHTYKYENGQMVDTTVGGQGSHVGRLVRVVQVDGTDDSTLRVGNVYEITEHDEDAVDMEFELEYELDDTHWVYASQIEFVN